MVARLCVSPEMDQVTWPVRGVPCLSYEVSWDWLQFSCDPQQISGLDNGGMDVMFSSSNSSCHVKKKKIFVLFWVIPLYNLSALEQNVVSLGPWNNT